MSSNSAVAVQAVSVSAARSGEGCLELLNLALTSRNLHSEQFSKRLEIFEDRTVGRHFVGVACKEPFKIWRLSQFDEDFLNETANLGKTSFMITRRSIETLTART